MPLSEAERKHWREIAADEGWKPDDVTLQPLDQVDAQTKALRQCQQRNADLVDRLDDRRWDGEVLAEDVRQQEAIADSLRTELAECQQREYQAQAEAAAMREVLEALHQGQDTEGSALVSLLDMRRVTNIALSGTAGKALLDELYLLRALADVVRPILTMGLIEVELEDIGPVCVDVSEALGDLVEPVCLALAALDEAKEADVEAIYNHVAAQAEALVGAQTEAAVARSVAEDGIAELRRLPHLMGALDWCGEDADEMESRLSTAGKALLDRLGRLEAVAEAARLLRETEKRTVELRVWWFCDIPAVDQDATMQRQVEVEEALDVALAALSATAPREEAK